RMAKHKKLYRGCPTRGFAEDLHEWIVTIRASRLALHTDTVAGPPIMTICALAFLKNRMFIIDDILVNWTVKRLGLGGAAHAATLSRRLPRIPYIEQLVVH
ncbi:133_t:CDS:1, partial [Acaulospora colombiana]